MEIQAVVLGFSHACVLELNVCFHMHYSAISADKCKTFSFLVPKEGIN